MNRRNTFFIILSLSLSTNLLYAQNPFTGITTGISSKLFQSTAKNISNANSWEETEFEIKNPDFSLQGKYKLEKCVLTFHNNRLFRITGYLPRSEFGNIFAQLVGKYAMPKNRDLNGKDKSATWYMDFKGSKFMHSLSINQFYEHTVVSYEDAAQTNFHFTDLFKGSLLWVIVAIVGLFTAYMIFGWLMTSKCPKCKKRGLKVMGKSYDNPTDYDPALFSRDIHWDEVYHFKCKHCGHEKDDRYSGFWSWRRSQED